MNLLDDPWIGVVPGATGESRRISPPGIVDADVLDITAPRPDFRGALYQFLIGLLQTAYAPDDWDEWITRWETPPARGELEAAFAPYREAFELDADGPAFMQDFNLSAAEPNGIAGLLIDAPGGNTVELNKDHFIHRDGVLGMCPPCAATALFTLQINAPSGGAGHRVSLRGGGPLTSLRVPSHADATLWQRLWMNVLPAEVLDYPAGVLPQILPWMAQTRTSDAGGAGTTEPVAGIAHPLQAYWSMPRRIRLDFSHTRDGRCDVCGDDSDRILERYRTRNYGVNYAGAWRHPLTPYNVDPKQNDLPISLKGQKGGVGYRHWAALTLGGGTVKAAAVVTFYRTEEWRLPKEAEDVRLWVFGYDLDNAKARCWYDATLPLHTLPEDRVESFREAVEMMLDVAREASQALNRSVKEASTNRPGDRESDPAVAQSFWQASEAAFYEQIAQAAVVDMDEMPLAAPIYDRWLKAVGRIALRLFDEWVLSVPIEEMKMRRVVEAKSGLSKSLNKGAAARLKKMIQAEVATV